jgi:hypothetical protein
MFFFLIFFLSQSYVYDHKISELTRVDSNIFFYFSLQHFFYISKININTPQI